MSNTWQKFLILTILYGSGFALLWWSTSWKAALAVFILLWAARTEARFDREDEVVVMPSRRARTTTTMHDERAR